MAECGPESRAKLGKQIIVLSVPPPRKVSSPNVQATVPSFMSTSTISRVTTTTSSAANKFSAAVSTPRKQIASAQVHMHPSPNSPFSLASMKPNLPRRAAITRLQTNGTVLALYMVVWALPRHYRTAKAVWTSLISWAVGLEWALWVNAALGKSQR